MELRRHIDLGVAFASGKVMSVLQSPGFKAESASAVWPPLLWGALFHLLMSCVVQLSPDEAHYGLYATHLDWSYYDHPPLVGWLQWPWAMGFGSDVAMRWWPMCIWLMTGWGLVRLSGQLYPTLATFRIWGVRIDLLLFVLSPLPHLLGFALVPDTVLMGILVWTMNLTWAMCQTSRRITWTDWLGLGLLLGLAGLTKYTAILLALGAMLCLLHAHGLGLLKQRGPWCAVLVALLCITPVVAWNATHDWASFTYQLNHAQGGRTWSGVRVIGFAMTIIVSMGLILPMAIAGGLKTPASNANGSLSPHRFSVYWTLPGLLLFLWLSGGGSTLPHWVVPFVVALMPCAAWGLVKQWPQWSSFQTWILRIQALLMVVFFAVVLSGGTAEQGAQQTSLAGQDDIPAAKNPFADLFGWQQAAMRAQQLAVEQHATALAVMNWTLASRVAWYARPWPVKVIFSHQDQFDLWFGKVQPTDRVIVLDWSIMSFKPPVSSNQFKRCEFLEQMPAMHAGRQISHFNFLLCEGWSE